MSDFHKRYDFYREHGLDSAGRVAGKWALWGELTPELAQALARLADLLTVNDVMEGRPVQISLEVPPELDEAFQAALKGDKP